MKWQIREIKVIDLITYAIIPLLLIVALWTAGLLLINLISSAVAPWISYVVYAIITYFLLQRFAIGLVLVYKAFAPLNVRGKCRFEPTCSTYMIMAIQKYGLIVGVIKGIGRLHRCKPPNSGEDYP